MQSHDHYEELCAAAVSGQIRRAELGELKEHMNTCVECCDFLGDVGPIVVEKIPELMLRSSPPTQKPPGMSDRFIARAHSEGIPLSQRRKSGVERSTLGFVLLAAALIAAILALALWMILVGPFLRQPDTRDPIAQTLGPRTTVNDAVTRLDQLEVDQLTRQLQEAQDRLKILTAKLKLQQDGLDLAARQKSEANSRLPTVEKANSELRNDLANRDIQLARIQADLDRVESEKEAGRVASQIEEAELNTLRDRVAKLMSDLAESEQLSGAAKQARDLITARRLHIVDVDDTDGEGRTQRPFGRIFYTEGNKLLFYAYDLGDQRTLNAKIEFYVWGSREGATKPVKELGILRIDNVTDRRWVLEFKDPGVLAQIDCVFVTAESDKRPVVQPTGRQILYASLGKANHP